MTNSVLLGRLLRASTQACVIGCKVSQTDAPTFGSMIQIPLDDGTSVYGLVHDIHIDDDGLVRQLVTAQDLPDEVILDNRMNRNVPIEMSVIFVGYKQGEKVFHLLPPRPPLSLDGIYACTDAEVCQFTAAGRFGYFRHILTNQDLPAGELLAAHLQQAGKAQTSAGNRAWIDQASRELITLLRDDYNTLINVLGAVADTDLGF